MNDCVSCHSKQPYEFEQSTNIILQRYRLPWFKEQLLDIEEGKEFWLDITPKDDEMMISDKLEFLEKADKENIAQMRNDQKTANDLLKTVNRCITDNYCIEIPLNGYQRDWLEDIFSYERKFKRKHLNDARERKDEIAIVELKGDLEMINHLLKIIAISGKICKVCHDARFW